MSARVTHQQIIDSLAEGSKKFAAIEQAIADNSKVAQECAEQLKLLPDLKRDIEEATGKIDEMREMLDAWTAIKTFAKGVKWFAGLIAAIAAIWAAFKVGIIHAVR